MSGEWRGGRLAGSPAAAGMYVREHQDHPRVPEHDLTAHSPIGFMIR